MRLRFALGVLFAFLGVVSWTALLWIPRQPPGDRWPVTEYLTGESTAHLPAVVLAVGGLILCARGWRPGTIAALVVGLAWAGIGFAVDLPTVDPLFGGVVAAVAVAAVAAAAGYRTVTDPAPAPGLLVYSGVALAVLPVNVIPLVLTGYAGSALDVVALAVHVALFLALPACALLVAASVRTGRAGGLALALVLIGAVLAVGAEVILWFFVHDPRTAGWLVAINVIPGIGAAVLAAACAALAGAFEPGRRGAPTAVAAAVLSFCLLTVGTLPLTIPILAGIGDIQLWQSDLLAIPARLLSALGLGIGALLSTRLGRGARPSATAARGWRPVGWAFAGLGIVGWSLLIALVDPEVEEARRRWFEPASEARPVASSDELSAFVSFASDLRWAAMLLAVGGLLLVIRGRWLRALTGVVAWLAADVVLDLIDVRGWPVAVGGAIVVALAFVVLLGPSRPGGVGRGALVYSGAASGVAMLTFGFVDAWAATELPSWAMPVAVALVLLLVFSAVVAALAAAPSLTPARLWAGVTVAVAGGAGAVFSYWASVEWSGHDRVLVALVEPLLAGALTVACVLLAGVDRRMGWGAAALAVLPGAAVPLTGRGQAVSSGIDLLVQPHTDELLGYGSMTVAGIFMGVILAAAMAALTRPSPVD